MAGRRPRTPTNEERLAEDLERVRANDPKTRFVDWASREVTDDQLTELCDALAHNNYLRKLHLSFNPGITNVGATRLEAALPFSKVAAVWLEATAVSEDQAAAIAWRCVANGVRLVAVNDPGLTSLNWSLVGVPRDSDAGPLIEAARAGDTRPPSETARPEPWWLREGADSAVAGALADALSGNTNLVQLNLMSTTELSPMAAAQLESAIGRSSVDQVRLSCLPAAAHAARQEVAAERRRAAAKEERDQEEREQREAKEREKLKPRKPSSGRPGGGGRPHSRGTS